MLKLIKSAVFVLMVLTSACAKKSETPADDESGSRSVSQSITYKSAKSTSSYYQMGVQFGEVLKAETDGAYFMTIEESQGSVQNVAEAARREGNYIFTSPASLVVQAIDGVEPFDDAPAAYAEIRTLFPIPSLNMQFIVSQQSGVEKLEDLNGKDYVIGKGTFSARKTEELFSSFGITPNYVDIEMNTAGEALKNGKVAGFTSANSWPTPNIIEVAASTPIRLLNFSPQQLEQIDDPLTTIPAGTYKNVDYDVESVTLPVIVYTLSSMSEETAYVLTKNFWEARSQLIDMASYWQSVHESLLSDPGAKLHAGAARYYRESGMELPEEIF